MAISEEFIRGMLELSRVTVHQESLEETLQHITSLTARGVGGIDGVGLTLVEGIGPSRSWAEGKVGQVAGRSSTPTAVRTSAHSSQWVLTIDECQYEAGEGPCLMSIADGKHHEASVERGGDFPGFLERAATHGLKSSAAVPLENEGKALGALNLYSRSSDTFDDETIKTAEQFAMLISAALGNIDAYRSAVELAHNLEAAMESRATIEQAKGMIMMERGCTADEAFQTLVAASQARNKKLRDIAIEIVDGARRGPAS
ncbi:MAG: ANTAR domain-containing protein [Actinobacteria bacterium]|nr:ANTAR domain-containing protein [Actinomycetota bacterium]